MRRDRIALLQALRQRFPTESPDSLTALVVCRRVLVDGEVVSDPKQPVFKDARIALDEAEGYVSRGGYKLEGALQAFALDVTGLTLLDAGASTGGFTDCLLKSGAKAVHAVDVGYNQLDWRLRSDGRVIVHERTNIMELRQLEPQPDAAVCDLSFRSVTKAASHILSLCRPGAFLVALIKPQFETPKGMEGFDGVIREPEVLKTVLGDVLSALIDEGLGIRAVIKSPIAGAKGNTEFFALLSHENGLTRQALLSTLPL